MGLLKTFIFVEDFFYYKDGEILQNTYRHCITEVLPINNTKVYFLHDTIVLKHTYN